LLQVELALARHLGSSRGTDQSLDIRDRLAGVIGQGRSERLHGPAPLGGRRTSRTTPFDISDRSCERRPRCLDHRETIISSIGRTLGRPASLAFEEIGRSGAPSAVTRSAGTPALTSASLTVVARSIATFWACAASAA